MELGDGLPPVQCIPNQIMQVLLNLTANAMDAMELTPRADRVLTLRTERRGDAASVSVLDRGHGIKSEDSEKLFRSFFTTRSGGMGLGLAIVSSSLQAHIGRVWAENLASGGSAFHFTLQAPPRIVSYRRRPGNGAPFHTNRLFCTAAAMKLVNRGCGSSGRDFSSGWNCTPMNQG